MAACGVRTNRKALFLLLVLGLAFILSMFSLKPGTKNSTRLYSVVQDGIAFAEGGVSQSQAKDTAAVRNVAEFDVLEAFRKWDFEVGCAKYRKQLPDQHENSWFKSLHPEEQWRCSDLQMQHVSVLVKTFTWIPDSFNGLHTCGCGLTCLWTKSQLVADNPDLHLYEGSRPPLQSTSPSHAERFVNFCVQMGFKRTEGGPLRAYVDMEAGALREEEDLFLSFRASADVQVTYASIIFAQNRNHYISSRKRTDVLVYWSSSRCVEERQAIARTFLALVTHHSFGNCLNNVGRGLDTAEDPLFQMYPECKTGGGDISWTRHIHCAMSHYMFALAIENTMTESYVTEKLFYALDAGTVPIYFGAPNVLDLVPPHSIILGADFNSTEALVAYVEAVARDPVRYAEFHAWRRCGELRNYRHTWAVSFDNMPCRLCATVSKLGGKTAPAMR